MPGLGGKLLKFGAKVGVCGGAVYYTAQEGVWSDGGRGQQAYQRLTQDIPSVREYLPSELNLPDTSEMRRSVSLYWNWAVIGLTEVLAATPQTVTGWATSGKDALMEMLVVTPEQVKEKGQNS